MRLNKSSFKVISLPNSESKGDTSCAIFWISLLVSAEFKLKKEQLANYFEAKEDIFELIPNQKTNQIFTPKKVVQMMINQLDEHDPSLFTRTDSTFIDLYMKSGMYITEIVKKLFNSRT